MTDTNALWTRIISHRVNLAFGRVAMRSFWPFGVLLALVIFPACDSNDSGSAAFVVSTETLVGTVMQFSSQNNTGGVSTWEYSFPAAGQVQGCNQFQSYQAIDWTIEGETTVRIWFSNGWEQYTFERESGSFAEGTLQGSFSLTTSASTSGQGTVRQIPSHTLSGCN